MTGPVGEALAAYAEQIRRDAAARDIVRCNPPGWASAPGRSEVGEGRPFLARALRDATQKTNIKEDD